MEDFDFEERPRYVASCTNTDCNINELRCPVELARIRQRNKALIRRSYLNRTDKIYE